PGTSPVPATGRGGPQPATADSHLAEQDAPPPPRRTLFLPLVWEVSFHPDQDLRDVEAFWYLLQNETFHQRGEGFRKDWAFHRYAVRHRLGAPLAPTAGKAHYLEVDGKQYGYQPFASDTLLNEIPRWGKVQRLTTLLGGRMPSGGLALKLLEATYRAVGTELHPDWAFHGFAMAHQLGPALGDSHRITVDGQEYAMQVFAGDTLYCPVPDWFDVRQLSHTPASSEALYTALWEETCRVSGTPYHPDSPFHLLAASKKLGTPLSGIYPVDLEGTTFMVQVFALDTLYAPADAPESEPLLLSYLVAPAASEEAPEPEPEKDAPEPDPGEPGDALSRKRPVFTMLPVAGNPRISQFYGYTRFAAGRGRAYYGACQGHHPGIDFAVPVGTPLLAIGHGVVVCAGVANRDCPFGGCPPMIAILRYGNVYAIYGHASQVVVRKGQPVRPGDVVGLSGDYGGPHLHFEIRPVPPHLLPSTDPHQPPVNPGHAVNPVDYFAPDIQAYFEQALDRLGRERHFCAGSLRDQEPIIFGGPVDTRPCAG
ncbi:MAG: M23 family metallopeptidase, partial [Chloroflexaceae bacterium]|nr:M23 family metallopeptidase [Chloroflexaceae bacterium]